MWHFVKREPFKMDTRPIYKLKLRKHFQNDSVNNNLKILNNNNGY